MKECYVKVVLKFRKVEDVLVDCVYCKSVYKIDGNF